MQSRAINSAPTRQMLRRVGFFDASPSKRHPFDQGGLTGQESDTRLPSPLLIRSIFPTGDMRDELPVYHSAADRFLDIVLLFTPALLLGALAAKPAAAAKPAVDAAKPAAEQATLATVENVLKQLEGIPVPQPAMLCGLFALPEPMEQADAVAF